MNAALLEEFVSLKAEKAELEAKAKAIGSHLVTLERTILDDFATEGVSSVKLNGSQTGRPDNVLVYLHRSLHASPKEGNHERACHALEMVGMNQLLERKFNVQSVSAYIRELDTNGDPIPDVIKEAFNVAEIFSVRTRKG